MLKKLTIDDVCEYIAFSHLEPFGDDWRQTGRIIQHIYANNPYSKHVPELKELIPIYPTEEPEYIDPEIARMEIQNLFADKGMSLKGFIDPKKDEPKEIEL